MFVIAGATGHVGGGVATELLVKGEKVRVLVRDAAKGKQWSTKGAEVSVLTLEDTKALTAALKGATAFFVLLPSNFQTPDFFAYQKKTAGSIAAAVKESGVPHVVLLSSVGADLAEGTGPIKGLHYLEKALQATGAKLTAVRAGYFQENVHNDVPAARNAGIFANMTASADYPMPMIATRDIALLVAHELMFPSVKSDVVDLAGPSYSVRDLAEKLGARLGKKLDVVDVPPAGQVDAMVQGGLSKDMAELYAEMYAGFGAGRIKPVGDRMKVGRTAIDAVLATIS